MSENISFHLGDLLNQGGGKDSIPDHVSENQDNTTHELGEESVAQQVIDDLGLDKDREELAEIEKPESTNQEKESKTLSLKKHVKKPSLYERQLKSLAEQQDARIKALESALLEKQKTEGTLRKVSQELYKYGSLKDKETIQREEYILNEQLKEALYAGDIERQIAINQQLRELVPQKSKLDQRMPDYLEDPKEEENYFGDNYYNQPMEEVSASVNPAFQEWYDSNPWLQIDHLKQKAADVMENLDGELSFDGKMDLIGTPQYFEEINKRMRNQFKKGKMQSTGKYGSQPPLPVSNGSGMGEMSGAEYSEKEPWKRIKLDADQMDSAMRTLGFNEQQKGKPLTRAEKIEKMQKHLYHMRNMGNSDEPITLW